MQPVADKRYEDRVVRISELVEVDGLLEGFTFERCHIDGPAIIVPSGHATLTKCSLGPSLDAVLWEIPPTRPAVVGAIEARDCVFDGCEFRNVGLAGPPDFVERIRGDVDV